LLLYFYPPTEGTIHVNDVDVVAKDPSYVRSLSSYVPQDTNLFNRTIRENVAYAKPGSSDEQIRQALGQADALDFVEQLPKGLETLVGERGVKLSGGKGSGLPLPAPSSKAHRCYYLMKPPAPWIV
jgi:ATP-binding cassette subfamily B protein